MNTPTLYDFGFSGNAYKVRLLLHHLGVALPVTDQEIAGWQRAGRRGLKVMEGHLKGRAFFVGELPTIADLCLYAYTHVAGEAGVDLAPFPEIRAWHDRVAALPGHVAMGHPQARG